MKRAKALLVAAGLVVASVAMAADGPDEVRIGGQVKKTLGVVKSAEAGDIACYLTLVDARGAEFTEMADFELCEAKLVGRRVRLSYRLEQVASAKCEGDPDCKLTDTVPLVVKADPVDGPAAKPAASASFCTAGEQVVFECRTGKSKTVSVCASGPAAGAALHYRFGVPGAAPEMALAGAAARGGNDPYAGGGAAWLRFRSGAHAYVVYTGIGNWGPRGEKLEKQGLVVEKGGATIAHMPCAGPVRSELGPDWFELARIERGDDEFLIPE